MSGWVVSLISSCLLQDYYDDNDVLIYSIDLLSLQDYTRTFLHIILSLFLRKEDEENDDSLREELVSSEGFIDNDSRGTGHMFR